jgi:hypothetical protein
VRRDHLTPSPSLSRRERNRRPPLPQLPSIQSSDTDLWPVPPRFISALGRP